ncbi:TonB-dependent receptor [Bacteroides sp. 51]|uniref:SusC/RagA family TonB-linked outer membrane protein n=1 Tax=Bacteroides sp. 51 TaxID=2302938 RepID=UPI0013D5388E|nr:TonB-dependent receptor [Bacteroides sp. 51]NDV81890.1 TonB-dependent receptor [Bacteroides sp. 51]
MKNVTLTNLGKNAACIFLFLLLFIGNNPLSAQTASGGKNITGVITDENGEPLIGANIIVKSASSVGTITDIDGKFSLNVPSKGTLLISYTGYTNKEVPVDTRNHYLITLAEDQTVLDEVVVVGYGVMKKSDVISSVTSVKAAEMKKAVTLDIGEMLRGKAAGVQITTSYAGPGGGSDIQIRGVNSISGGTAPIIIADGVTVGSINDVNASDIESVEVLKDAAAQSIYGARAANGVVLITTKRGAAGKTSVNYDGFYGFQDVKRNFEVYTPEEFMQYKREAYRTTNGGVYGDDADVFTPLELQSIENGDFIDWQKELLRTGTIQKHNVSVTSGGEKTKIFTSLSYEDQKGVVRKTDFKKYQVRFNLDQIISSWLTFGLNANLSFSEANDPGMSGILIDAVTCSPLGKVYDEEGNLNMHPTGLQENWNPLVNLNERTSLKKNRTDLVNVFFDIKPFKGLNYRLNLSRRSWNYKQENYNTANSEAGVATGKGSGSLTNRDGSEWTLDNILSYENSFGKNNISATFIQSWNEKRQHSDVLSASLIPNDMLHIYGFESAEKLGVTLDAYKRRLISTALRVQYNYASKYYVSLSGRRDGSSVFGANEKWGVFPAAAIGWNAYMEPFLQQYKWLTNLKLRASYGSVGNEAIAPYGSIASADRLDYYAAGQMSGYAPGTYLSNPNLKWETSTTLNGALDFGFFNNRISGTIEFYKTNTTDLLVNRSINSSTGYTTMKDNIGEIENKGIELQMNGVLVKNRDLTIQAGFTFFKNKNKIVKLFGDLDGDGVEDDYPANSWFIGQPISVFYSYEAIGIWQESEKDDIPKSAQPTAEPGHIKLHDRDGNGKLDDEDKVITSRLPKWNGSFNLSAEYKGFDFSADLYTVQGILKSNPFLYDFSYGGNLRAVFNGIKVDYWTPENPTAKFPRPTTNGATDLGPISRQDASYFRLQNITLGYNFQKNVLSKLRLQKLRLYVTGQNLWTSTDFEAYSPEQPADSYPEARSLSFGVQLGF